MNRHDMLLLSQEGLCFACCQARKANPDMPEENIAAVLQPGIPAIVRRQEKKHNGLWEVGFSSHKFRNGSRLRLNSLIPASAVEKTITPFDAALMCITGKKDAFGAAVVKALTEAGKQTGFNLGIYGSLALQTVTGKPYFTKSSDCDVYIKSFTLLSDAEKFYDMAGSIETAYGIRVDCEIDYKGFGIKLKELFSGQKTFLCKGLYEVKLLKSTELYRTVKTFTDDEPIRRTL